MPDDAVALGATLAEVRLQDFRAVEDLWLPVGRVTVLLGENNSGKTTVLRAVGLALGEFQASEDDFRVRPDGVRLTEAQIDLRFEPAGGATEFDDETRQRFDQAVQGVVEGSEYIAMRATVRQRSDGRGIDVPRRFLRGWARERDSAAELTVLGQHLGVFGRHLEHSPFSYLGPARDVVEDMRSRTSNWGKLLSGLELPDALRTELESVLESVGQQIVSGSTLLERLQTELKELAAAMSVGVESVAIAPIPVSVGELARSVDVHAGAPGARSLPMRVQGLGARSLASMMVFRAFAAARSAQAEIHVQPITAYEEPEAHLHPQSQRAVSDMLHALPGQVLISTHSSLMASVADPFDWRLLRHYAGRMSVGYLTSPAAQDVGASEDELRHAASLLLGRGQEALFGRLVIAAEGDTEEIGLGSLARQGGVDGVCTVVA